MVLAEHYLLKDFLDTVSVETKDELLSFLDTDTQEIIADIHALAFNPSKGLKSYQDRLKLIHPSWFIALIQDLSDFDKYILIGSLCENVREQLFQHFQLF